VVVGFLENGGELKSETGAELSSADSGEATGWEDEQQVGRR
jgi:hypothetical protein